MSEADIESAEGAARRELKSSLGFLVAIVIVLALTLRGVFSYAWFFPHIFGGVMAILALVSLRKSWRVLWKLRLSVVVAVIGIAAVLPAAHVRGVNAELESYERRAGAALVGNAAPSVPFAASLHYGDGSAGTYEPGGRIAMLNFWATWCAPCVAEMPLLQTFWLENGDRGIYLIGVTRPYRGRDPEAERREVETLVAERPTTYPIVIADRGSHLAYGVESLPSSVLVGRDGKVVAFGAGSRGTLRLMELAKELASR